MLDIKLIKAKSYAYRLIDYRPRSEKEFEDRLKKRGFDKGIIEKVISDFKNEGLLGDEKFTKLWIEMRSQSSPRGLSLIRLELLSKGVDRELVDNAIEDLRGDFGEEEKAKKALRGRLRSVEGLERQKAKARLFGYLKRRGFSSQVIWKVIDEAYRT